MVNIEYRRPPFSIAVGPFAYNTLILVAFLAVCNAYISSNEPQITRSENHNVLLFKTEHAPRWKEEENSPAFVEVIGDPKRHALIKLKVTTSDLVLNFDLRKAEPVTHPDTRSVTVQKDPTSGGLTYIATDLEPDVLAYSNLFFYNSETGTIVSVRRQPGGHYHIRGHLTYQVAIAPAASPDRHRRAVRPERTHTLYSIPLDRDRDMADDETLSLAIGNRLLNSVETKRSKDWTVMKKLNAILTDEWSEEYKKDLEEEAEVDLEDDYLEVPSIFASEEAWKAHQSQAEGKSNTVHEKENEEDELAYLSFHKPDQESKNRENRKRRAVKSDQREFTITVDKTLRIPRQFRAKVKHQNVASTTSMILKQTGKEIAEDFLPKKISFRPVLANNERIAKYKTGIITKHSVINKVGHAILYQDPIHRKENRNGFKEDSMHTNNLQAKTQNMAAAATERSYKSKNSRTKRQLSPDTQDVPGVPGGHTSGNLRRGDADFLVEVAVVVDVSVYKEFNYDWKQLQIFLLHFWQSVNARFKAMVDPKVQLRLKSINKIMFNSMQPFIERNRISPMSERVSVTSVLEEFRSYVSEHYESNPQMPDHDIAVLLTGEDLCKKKPDGSWSKSSRGIAFVQGACISSRRFRNQTYDVGVAEIGRSYRGVLTTAHEVGHLLGAFHDGEKSARSCATNSGHLMSQTWSKPYLYNRFSQCSRRNFRDFMRNTWYSDCLLSADSRHAQILTAPNTLPGQHLSLKSQCHYYISGKPCRNVPLESQCGRLCCEKWSQPFPSNEPAADGTACGPDKMCYNGECLHKYALPSI